MIVKQHLPLPARRARAYLNVLVDTYQPLTELEFARNSVMRHLVEHAKVMLAFRKIKETDKDTRVLVDLVTQLLTMERIIPIIDKLFPYQTLIEAIHTFGWKYVVSRAIVEGGKTSTCLDPTQIGTLLGAKETYKWKTPDGVVMSKGARGPFSVKENDAWKRRMLLFDAPDEELRIAYEQDQKTADFAAIQDIRKYRLMTRFQYDGNWYGLVIGPGVLKTFEANKIENLELAIIPFNTCMIELMQSAHNPSFEHFDGAVAIAGISIRNGNIVIEEWQTDTPYLFRRAGITGHVQMPELVIAALRVWARELRKTKVHLVTPYWIFKRYERFPLEKARLYTEEPERVGGTLIFDDRAKLSVKAPQTDEPLIPYDVRRHYYKFDLK